MLAIEVQDMKCFITIGLFVLVTACAPGNAPSPEGTTTADRAPIPTARADDPARGAPPAGNLEVTGVESQIRSGQTLYVAVYSHVYWGPKQTHFNLACTLSIRNVDPTSPITVTTVDYYDTAGAHVRHFIDQPRYLAPLETVDFYIKERDTTGGSGANFIVRWDSPTAVNAPIVEAVMIGVDAGQGISFVCPAREIAE